VPGSASLCLSREIDPGRGKISKDHAEREGQFKTEKEGYTADGKNYCTKKKRLGQGVRQRKRKIGLGGGKLADRNGIPKTSTARLWKVLKKKSHSGEAGNRNSRGGNIGKENLGEERRGD